MANSQRLLSTGGALQFSVDDEVEWACRLLERFYFLGKSAKCSRRLGTGDGGQRCQGKGDTCNEQGKISSLHRGLCFFGLVRTSRSAMGVWIDSGVVV